MRSSTYSRENPSQLQCRQKHSPPVTRFTLLHCKHAYIPRRSLLKQTLTLNETNASASCRSHPAGRNRTRRRLLFRELLSELRHARPVRADWPRRCEGGDESMRSSGKRSFQKMNHSNSSDDSLQTPQTGSFSKWPKP